jgi:CelD/BcsL family acetyltransferase involved in cellulose biosynthesis
MVDCHESIEVLAPEWDDLADRIGAAPWLRPGWFSAWWESFGSGTLRIYAARDDGRLVGVVPTAKQRRRVTSASNWHTPAFGLLGKPEAIARLAAALFGDRPQQISLAFVTEQRDADAVRRAAREHGYQWISRTLERSPYVAIDGSWEEYERSRASKLLSELRRRRRRLAEEGELSFECDDGGEQLDERLAEGFEVEAAGWKGAGGSAISSRSDTDRFYRAVAHWAAHRGWLRLAFLRLDGKPFAFDLAIEHDGVHYLLKTGFDPSFSRFAPGMILRHEMLSRAFAVGLRSYEFLGADNAWKLDWTETTRDRDLLQAFARSPSGLVEWAANRYGRPVAKRVLRR